MNARSPLISADSLALVAVTHVTAAIDVLERVNLDADGSEGLERCLLAHPGISEAVVVSTCNRTELYLYGPSPDTEFALGILAAHSRVRVDCLDGCVVNSSGGEAALHLLRVAAGLESRVVGEAEILGQIRSSIAAACAAGSAGSYLTSLFRFAIAAGRRSQHTVDHALVPSLPRLALDAADADLANSVGLTLVVGSGSMAGKTTAELAARGRDYRVCARRPERALQLAGSADRVVSFEDLTAALEHAQVVVCATGARLPLLRVADLEQVMARRAGRPLTIVDLSLPRNVEPTARDIAGIRLLDLDDLVAGSGQLHIRQREEIVGEEMLRYRSWLAGRTIGHLLAQLHDRVETECRHTIERSRIDGGGTPESVAVTARSMANKLLHGPTVTIKNLIAAGDEGAAFAVLASYGVGTESKTPCRVIDLPMREAS